MLLAQPTCAASTGRTPIAVVQHPSGWPLAIIAVAKSKGPLVLNFDTGARLNLLFLSAGESFQALTDVSIPGALQKVAAPEFLGDTLERVDVELVLAGARYSVPVAVVRLPGKRIGPRVTLGIAFFLGRAITLDFSSLSLSISNIDEATHGDKGAANSRSVSWKDGRFSVDVGGTDYVLDTGVLHADILQFSALADMLARPPLETIVLPGPLGEVICTLPRVGGPRAGLISSEPYVSTCAFLRDSSHVPKFSVVGLRSLIEKKSTVTIQLPVSAASKEDNGFIHIRE